MKILIFIFFIIDFYQVNIDSIASKAQYDINIGVTHAPPLVFLSDNRPPEGMLIDFLNAVAVHEHWNINWITGSWQDVFNQAKNNKIDLMTYIAYSVERAESFDFSNESFITGWGQVYTKNNNIYQNILDFDNKKIAILKNDIHAKGIIDLCSKFKINCNFEYVDNYDIGFELLKNDKIEGVVCGSSIGVTYESKYDIDRTSIMFNPTNALFAVAKNNKIFLLKVIDNYLKKWRNTTNSPYEISKVKWMNTVRNQFIPKWLNYLLFTFIGLLIISISVLIILRRQIKKHVKRHIKLSKQLGQIIDLVPHMIYVLNVRGKIQLVNTYAANFFGVKSTQTHTKKQLLNNAPDSKNLFEDDSSIFQADVESINKELSSTDVENKNITFNLYKVPLNTNSSNSSVLTIGIDLTEEKEYQDKIRFMAEHDELTKLPNRKLLQSDINSSLKELQNNKQIGAVLFIDLDFFKNINDSLGHVIGDKLLIVISKRLKSIVKTNDLVARIGGDEFIIHLKDITINVAEANEHITFFANEVLKLISSNVVVDKQELYVSASIGIVVYPRDAKSYEYIIQRADIAMYKAKSLGRNKCIVFQESMEKSIQQTHSISSDLRKAVHNNDFSIEYQPQIHVDKNIVVGFEALIRWNHPDGFVLYPNDFIKIAEETNLIVPIGNLVFEKVFSQLHNWMKKYKNLPFITINVSVIQLHDDRFIKNLNNLLQKYGVSTDLIEIELTETIMIEQVEKSIYVLSQLKNLGVKLLIDDFGTGYSSLSYLKKLPFDKLKIDYSFVKDIAVNNDTKAIVKTIIGMSKDLGLEVIAEGVETEEQLNILTNMGCKTFQGFYFDSPKPVAYIEKKYLTIK